MTNTRPNTKQVTDIDGETGGVSRTAYDKFRTIGVVPEDFGAVGDGVTDDTAAIANALLASREHKVSLYIPSRTYLTDNLVVAHRDSIVGMNKYLSVIKLNTSKNTPVISGTDAATLMDTNPGSPGTAGASYVQLRNFTIDGNGTNQTSGGIGIQIWGKSHDWDRLIVKNCELHGIHSEFTGDGETLEGTFSNLEINDVGGHGWLCYGPQDSDFRNIKIIDAGQKTDDTYTGIFINSGAVAGSVTGRLDNVHVWHTATVTKRCLWAIQTGGGIEASNCHFEGARQQVSHGGFGSDTFIGCSFYAPTGAVGTSLVVVSSNSNIHSGCHYVAGDETTSSGGDYFQDDVYAITLSNSCIQNRLADGNFTNFDVNSPFNFASDGGFNHISGTGFCLSGGQTTFDGALHGNSSVKYMQSGTEIYANIEAPYGYFTNDTTAAAGGVPLRGHYTIDPSGLITQRIS